MRELNCWLWLCLFGWLAKECIWKKFWLINLLDQRTRRISKFFWSSSKKGIILNIWLIFLKPSQRMFENGVGRAKMKIAWFESSYQIDQSKSCWQDWSFKCGVVDIYGKQACSWVEDNLGKVEDKWFELILSSDQGHNECN